MLLYLSESVHVDVYHVHDYALNCYSIHCYKFKLFNSVKNRVILIYLIIISFLTFITEEPYSINLNFRPPVINFMITDSFQIPRPRPPHSGAYPLPQHRPSSTIHYPR